VALGFLDEGSDDTDAAVFDPAVEDEDNAEDADSLSLSR